MDFFTDFIPQIWPVFLVLLGGPIVLVILFMMIRRQTGNNRRRNLAASREQNRAEPRPPAAMPAEADDDDPLALLHQARAESLYDEDDDTPAADLADLLGMMGQPALHRVAPQPVHVRLPGGDVAEASELLSILRDERDGRLMVQIGETAYRTLLDDAEAKRTFTRVMKELSSVVLTADDAALPSVPPAAEILPDTAPPAPAPAPQPQAASQPEMPAEPAPDLSTERDDALPGDLPDLKLADNPDNYKRDRFGRLVVKRVDKAPEINIADAIEAYLQFKIERAPQYQRRGIHIRPSLTGGVRIEADGKTYEFVDEVEDPDVRQLLQTTIAEWQERH